MKILKFFQDNKVQVLEAFLLSNVAFLAIDIWVAHSFNQFHHPGEWIPFYYCIIATIIMTPTALMSKFKPIQAHFYAGAIVGWAGVIIGLVGLFYHLESQFFKEFSISALVYTAPFLAPLAFTGIGFLFILNRSKIDLKLDWHRWVIFFALGGCVGNFGLALCDHAQNGFFHVTEWIPVFGSAIGISALSMCLFIDLKKSWLTYVNLIMLLQILIGVGGFALHLLANINGKSEDVYQNFVYGAPVFAPLLFANIAALALIATVSYHQEQ